MSKNVCFRHGTFFYSRALDDRYSHLSALEAYDSKSAFIQRTADELRLRLDKTPFHEVACVVSHVYEFKNSTRDDGSIKQPHIHVLWWQQHYIAGTTKLLDDFFANRRFGGIIIY